jgi:hypothetical protein
MPVSRILAFGTFGLKKLLILSRLFPESKPGLENIRRFQPDSKPGGNFLLLQSLSRVYSPVPAYELRSAASQERYLPTALHPLLIACRLVFPA